MTTVAEMSKEELRDLISVTIEDKLLELLGTSDDGELLEAVQERLLEQKEAVARGERGQSFADVAKRLDLQQSDV